MFRIITDGLIEKAFLTTSAIACTFCLTCYCNFKCRMCAFRMNEQQSQQFGFHKSINEWLDMARQIQKEGVLYLTITGGEPLIYPEFAKLYQVLYTMGFLITIKTNGSMITDEIVTLFMRYPPRLIKITLYGASNDTYEEVTGRINAFDNVMHGIRQLLEIGIKPHIVFTMTKINIRDYPLVDEIVRINKLECSYISDIYQHIYNNDYSESARLRLSPAERVFVAHYTPSMVNEALLEAKAFDAHLDNWVMPQKHILTKQRTIKRCLASCIGCFINWNGEMQYCGEYRAYTVDAFSLGFSEARRRLLSCLDDFFVLSNTCGQCEYSEFCTGHCPARLYIESLSITEPSNYICQKAYFERMFQTNYRKENGDGSNEKVFCSNI